MVCHTHTIFIYCKVCPMSFQYLNLKFPRLLSFFLNHSLLLYYLCIVCLAIFFLETSSVSLIISKAAILRSIVYFPIILLIPIFQQIVCRSSLLHENLNHKYIYSYLSVIIGTLKSQNIE